jgi:hypothetical protein
MVFNTTFNNISAISWQPVLAVEEAGVPEENQRPKITSELFNVYTLFLRSSLNCTKMRRLNGLAFGL